MNRRSILGMILKAPLATAIAPTIASATGAGMLGQTVEPPMGCTNEEKSPMMSNLRKLVEDEQQRRQELLFGAASHRDKYPPSIETKKSWSPAFKQHVFTEDSHAFRIKREDQWNLNDEQIIGLAKKLGISHFLKVVD